MTRDFKKMRKKVALLLYTAILCCYASLAGAQTTIRGTVSDSLKQPLPGVIIQIKGSKAGAVSAADGGYTLSSPTTLNESDVLTFAFLGFKKFETAINGRTTINVTLYENQVELKSVVVTALGIKRDEKSLGYAAQSLKENAVTDARTTNWVNSLSGKVAGLSIQGTG
jgi:hypothetical protein